MADDNGNQLEGKIGAFGFRLKGREAVVIGLLLIVFLFSAGLLLRESLAMRAELKEHDKMTGEFHGQLQESLEALIYVNTLSKEEQARLNLQMPKKLREMMRP